MAHHPLTPQRQIGVAALGDVEVDLGDDSAVVGEAARHAATNPFELGVDPDTGEVIRTLPSEELLRLARSFEMLGNKMVHQVA